MRMNRKLRMATVVAAGAACCIANAMTFDNISVSPPPLSSGWAFAAGGNSISFFTPNAMVGDPVDPLRSGTLQIQYDAHVGSDPAIFAAGVTVTPIGALLGSGTISFSEDVYEIDGVGNQLNLIGHVDQVFNSGFGGSWSQDIALDHAVKDLRAYKTFDFSAINTNALDVAALGIVNQNLKAVPEPSALLALAIPFVGLLKRRK